MTDPGSVVRESEFARIPENMSIVEGLRSKFLSAAFGGILTPTERQELFDLSTQLNNSWQKNLGERRQRYYLQLDAYNNSVDPGFRLEPEQFGLPVRTTVKQKSTLENLAPPGLFPDSPNPFRQNTTLKLNNVTDKDVVSIDVGGRPIKGQVVLTSALEAADAAFFADTGKHIDIRDNFRTSKQQQNLFEKSQRGEIGRAAPPGKSFHEKGLAIDVVNWEEVSPYLVRFGFGTGLPGDPGHFSIGEFS